MSLADAMNDVNGLGEGGPVGGERRTIPFDYAFRYDLTGEPNLTHNSTVNVSIEAAFTAVSIGYGVVPKVQPVKFGIAPKAMIAAAALSSFATTAPAASQLQTTTFGLMIQALSETLDEDDRVSRGELGPRTATVLADGFRLNPEFAERILLGGAVGSFDEQILAQAFQSVAAPPDQIQFKYAIFDEGSGREFQSEPILNTAGLGIADGMRPFRYFARPIEFAPRSTIRMQVIETSAFQGELHISLQGFKTLGAHGSPTGRRQMRRFRRMRR